MFQRKRVMKPSYVFKLKEDSSYLTDIFKDEVAIKNCSKVMNMWRSRVVDDGELLMVRQNLWVVWIRIWLLSCMIFFYLSWRVRLYRFFQWFTAVGQPQSLVYICRWDLELKTIAGELGTMFMNYVARGEDVENEMERGQQIQPWGIPWDCGAKTKVQLLL